jgi:hypothetical protein
MNSLPIEFFSKFLTGLWLAVSARVALLLSMQLFLLGAGAYNPVIAPVSNPDALTKLLNSVTIVLLFYALPASWIGYKIAFGDWLKCSWRKKFVLGFIAQFVVFHSMNVLILSLAKDQIGPLHRHSIHGCSFW